MVEDRPERFRSRVIVTRPSSSHGPLNAVGLTESRYRNDRRIGFLDPYGTLLLALLLL